MQGKVKQFYAYSTLSLLLSAQQLSAQTETAYSPPLGGIELTVDGLRETSLGLPLHRSAEGIAELGSSVDIDTNGDDPGGDYLGTRLTFTDVVGVPGVYNPDALTGELRYFAEFATGDAAGQRLPIVGSGENWVSVSRAPTGPLVAYFGDEQSGRQRDLVYIRPYWTLETVLGMSGLSKYDSGSPAMARNGDVVILQDAENLHSKRYLQLYNDASTGDDFWGELSTGGSGLVELNAAALAPGTAWKVRRASDAAVTYIITGDASSLEDWLLEMPASGAVVEIPFTLSRSDSISLRASGLSAIFRPAASASVRKDELIVWDNALGFHARPAERYYILADTANGKWVKVGDRTASDQGEVRFLEPGKGYLIRRRF